MIKKMKEYKVIIIAIISIFIILSGLKFIRLVVNNNFPKGQIGIDLPKGSIVLKKEDSHGGFHYDGEYYSEIQLTEDGVKEFTDKAIKSGEWSSFPLSKDIKIIIYGETYDTDKMSKGIPQDIKSGIYYIRDRYAEKNPSEKNKNINSRNSHNVTISILDFDTNKLYIYKLDT